MCPCLAAALSLLVGACASPSQRFYERTAELGLACTAVRGASFDHAVCFRPPPRPARTLHVYLEGDGIPWIQRTLVAADPTPRQPLALELMSLDPAPSIYLGRPCYHGHAAEPPCSPLLWTHARYAPVVIDSMIAALKRWLLTYPARDLVLLGHSGGGTIAMLLAPRLQETVGVVTIAANLDLEQWAQHHRYSPLVGSLDPGKLPPLAADVQQLHLAGDRDSNVPLGLFEQTARRERNAELRVIEGFDHACCWQRIWPAVLADVEAWTGHD